MSELSWYKKSRNWFLYLFIISTVKVIRTLPRMTGIKFLRAIARLFFILVRKERNKTIAHLTQAFGKEKSAREIKELARDVYLHFGTVAADYICIPGLLKKNFLKTEVSVSGIENLEKIKKQGLGAIFLTGHFGNFELLAAWTARNGFPLNVVGKPIFDERLNRLVVETRQLAGMVNIPRGKGTREIIRCIQRKETLGILIDQDTKVQGIFVDFFNKPAHTATAPVFLSQKYKIPIIPIFMRLCEGYKYEVICEPEIKLQDTGNPEEDLVVNTQKCSDAYQKIITRYPEQWVWMHRRWKKQP
jgi:Kdo2-lipid IVA lauroyltransferase/acyltransferase